MTHQTERIDMQRLPRHIAIIMDGNGRWARSRGNRRTDGHIVGVESVRAVIEAASELGIGYLTLYAFSTENWNRPREEVDMLLNLIVSVLVNETEGMKRNNVRLRMIGDIDRLTPEARASLENSMAETSGGTGLQVNLAISYSSRWEITEAMKKLAQLAAEGKIKPEDITEETISSHLTTASIPDPDILIRTGGEQRVSNYLLWQIAYSELYFTDIYWPDFRKEALEQAIIDYQSRERRFGLTSDQIKTAKK